jgi:heptose I phosphotransferase
MQAGVCIISEISGNSSVKLRTGKFDMRKEQLLLNEKYAKILAANGIINAESLWKLKGESVKKKIEERRTEKIILEDNGREIEMYLKKYRPISLMEAVKNIVCFKPVFLDGAIHEWKALTGFARAGIPTPEQIVAAEFSGQTCVMTLGIKDYIRASDLFASFSEKDFSRKKRLIAKIADIVARMHAANFAHQDLYLLHFFVCPNENDKVHIIDLQRVIISSRLSSRWLVKDLAQLLFSARDLCSEWDIARFWIRYTALFRMSLKKDKKFIARILWKAEKIKKRDKKHQCRSFI